MHDGGNLKLYDYDTAIYHLRSSFRSVIKFVVVEFGDKLMTNLMKSHTKRYPKSRKNNNVLWQTMAVN